MSEIVTLGAGEWFVHSLAWCKWHLFAGCRVPAPLGPGKVVRMDPANLANRKTATFPRSTAYGPVIQLAECAEKVYALTPNSIVEIDPETMEFKPRFFGSYKASAAMCSDGNDLLWVVSATRPAVLYRYSLTRQEFDFSELPINVGHGIAKDDRWVYATGSTTMSGAAIATPTGQMQNFYVPFPQLNDIATDDCAVLDGQLYVGVENETGTVLRLARDFTRWERITTGVNRPCFGCFAIGGFIYSVFQGGPPGVIVRIDPATLQTKRIEVRADNPSEIIADPQGRLFAATYSYPEPAKIIRLEET